MLWDEGRVVVAIPCFAPSTACAIQSMGNLRMRITNCPVLKFCDVYERPLCEHLLAKDYSENTFVESWPITIPT